MTRLNIGGYDTLEFVRDTEFGVVLGRDGDEVLLPNRLVPTGTRPGDRLRVFVYTDSEDRIVATTQTPHAVVGEFAAMDVVDVAPHGAFLDWGLDKHLLVPHREQVTELAPGDRPVVRVFLDEASGRVAASTRVQKFLAPPPRGLRPGNVVAVLVVEVRPLGYDVILNDSFRGLIYTDQAPVPLVAGLRTRGWVQRLRPDGRVDATMRPPIREALVSEGDLILQRLGAAGGFLPLHDGSEPEEIQQALGLSKKAFKRAVGALYRQRRISLEDRGIRLAMAPK